MMLSGDLFRELFPIPPHVTILGSVASDWPGYIEVVVQCGDFDDLAEGQSPPLIAPRFKQNDKGQTEFVSWKLT